MTFYATPPPAPAGSCRRSTSRRSGDDGFKKAPIGAGPYKFVSFTPGVELVLEAFEQYWRKAPSVKRLVFKAIPDEATRLAALKRGEVDIAYSIRGELGRGAPAHARAHAQAQRRSTARYWVVLRRPVGSEVAVARPARAPGREPTRSTGRRSTRRRRSASPRSPGASSLELRVLLAAARLLVRSARRPSSSSPKPAIPTAFDAGDVLLRRCDRQHRRARGQLHSTRRHPREIRPIGAGGLFSFRKNTGFIHGVQRRLGNAATRIEAFVAAGGTYVYGSYADIDGLFREQATELDSRRREVTLHRIQQLSPTTKALILRRSG